MSVVPPPKNVGGVVAGRCAFAADGSADRSFSLYITRSSSAAPGSITLWHWLRHSRCCTLDGRGVLPALENLELDFLKGPQ